MELNENLLTKKVKDSFFDSCGAHEIQLTQSTQN